MLRPLLTSSPDEKWAMSLRFLGQFLISESLQGDDDGGRDRECFSRYRRGIFLVSQGQPFIASRVLRSVADRSHSRSFDQRRRPETPRTAMATAFFWPTRTTSRLPRVTPV
jgi:hypothetical protein